MKEKLKTLFYIILIILSQKTYAQMMSEGNVFIHSKSNMTLFNSTLDFSKGIGISMPGIIGTERNYPRGYLTFADNANYKNVKDSLFVDGYVRSYNSGFFIFPIGDNNMFRPIAISNSSVNSPISAAYFGVDPSSAVTSSLKGGNEPTLPFGGPFEVNLLDSTLIKVNNKEYWDIDGQGSTQISISWDQYSDISNLTNNILERLTIVGWDGSKWTEILSKIDSTSFFGNESSLAKGSITTIDKLAPDSYYAYTLARKICKPTGKPIITCENKTKCDTICISESTRTFTVSGVINASGYLWSGDNGIMISSGQGTSSATINVSNAKEGLSMISVIPFNSCDSMSVINYQIFVLPSSACQTVTSLKDTCITTDTSSFKIGPSIVAPNGGTMAVGIYGLKYAGQATIDTTNALITINPSKTKFLGKDTLYRIICIKNLLGIISCDTSFICISNEAPNTPPKYDTTTENKQITLSAIPMYYFQGGTPTLSFISPKNGKATLNLDGTVVYTPNEGFSGDDSFTIIRCDSLKNCVSNTYYIHINQIKKVEPPISVTSIIPNYFSPNGDGINDYFDLTNLTSIYPKLKLEVYNRWGNIVYRSNGVYKNDWKGEEVQSGQNLPDGVYFYIIELNGDFQNVKNGYIEIMR